MTGTATGVTAGIASMLAFGVALLAAGHAWSSGDPEATKEVAVRYCAGHPGTHHRAPRWAPMRLGTEQRAILCGDGSIERFIGTRIDIPASDETIEFHPRN